jgi:hypothetical protein
MDVDGGGWTLALKVDPRSTRFEFTSSEWTNTQTFGTANASLDDSQAKLRSFSVVGVEEVLLGFAPTGGQSDDFRFLQLPLPAAEPSLLALFSTADDLEIVGGPPIGAWLGLAPNINIQPGCRRVFVNTRPAQAAERVRLGLVGSAGTDCRQAETSIGVGHPSVIAGADNVPGADQPLAAALLVRSRDLTAVGTFASCTEVAAAGFRRTADYLIDDTPRRCILP